MTSVPTDGPSAAVIDASAVLALLLDPGAGGARIGDHIIAMQAIAPQLLPFEVWNVLRRRRNAGLLDDGQADRANLAFQSLPIELWPTEAIRHRLWDHGRNMSSYDAAYVALAEVVGATLLTCDARLASAPGVECPVTLVTAG